MSKFVKLTECELLHDEMHERATCFVNIDLITYIEETEYFKGYSYIGVAGGQPTIVKGTPEQIIRKFRGKTWRKIIPLL